MKKLMLSFGVILLYLLYAFHKNSVPQVAIVPSVQTPTPGSNSTQQNSSASAPPNTNLTSLPALVQAGAQYRDGQYAGDVADAYYGNVQVQVTIKNGKIIDVVFLDYPQDRRTSMMINSQAMPYLKQEAIQAQSSRVDVVSGATATSGAFITSLESALAKART